MPHQQEARVAAREILQRGDRGRERQVLQRVPAQDQVVPMRQLSLQVSGSVFRGLANNCAALHVSLAGALLLLHMCCWNITMGAFPLTVPEPSTACACVMSASAKAQLGWCAKRRWLLDTTLRTTSMPRYLRAHPCCYVSAQPQALRGNGTATGSRDAWADCALGASH